ncbi:MAG: type II secretion system F family protein [Lentisphaerae bacterium]|nr:type II secretion system F family protein [Lentisphaerota bacterium]
MPKFKYTATDAQGSEKQGVVEAINRAGALVKLKELQLFPSAVAETDAKAAKIPAAKARGKGGPPAGGPKGSLLKMNLTLPSIFPQRIKRNKLMIFTRQLATLIDAGVPLLRALQVLQKQEPHGGLKKLIGEICEAVESGGTFAEALSHHPKVFDRLFVNMVKAGEIGGVLETTLNRLAEFSEKAEKIKTKVKGAMIYPIVVLVMALGILSFLMIYIIPKFQEIFTGLLEGQQLPVLTQFVMGASDLIIHNAPAVAIGLVGVGVAFKVIGKTKLGRLGFDWLALRVPIFGTLMLRVSISRVTRTLGTLLTSGVQILQSLNIVRETAGNEIVSRAIQKVHDSVKEGETVAAPLEASGVFPSMVVSMITVGEETGRLPDMLTKIADNYEGEVDAAVDGLTSIIEPILIVFLAVIVGTIVIAMFMPLISIISNLR